MMYKKIIGQMNVGTVKRMSYKIASLTTTKEILIKVFRFIFILSPSREN